VEWDQKWSKLVTNGKYSQKWSKLNKNWSKLVYPELVKRRLKICQKGVIAEWSKLMKVGE
jgi:hypothetical protein